MNPQIKKQIEEEALRRFPEDEYDDEYFTGRYYFKEGAKYGYIQQAEKRKIEAVELNDIIKCIIDFDDAETDEIKGKYFSTIQRDLRKLQQQQQ